MPTPIASTANAIIHPLHEESEIALAIAGICAKISRTPKSVTSHAVNFAILTSFFFLYKEKLLFKFSFFSGKVYKCPIYKNRMVQPNIQREKTSDFTPLNEIFEKREPSKNYYCIFCEQYRDARDIAVLYPAKPSEGLCFQHFDGTED